jgi:hypothetical protein
MPLISFVSTVYTEIPHSTEGTSCTRTHQLYRKKNRYEFSGRANRLSISSFRRPKGRAPILLIGSSTRQTQPVPCLALASVELVIRACFFTRMNEPHRACFALVRFSYADPTKIRCSVPKITRPRPGSGGGSVSAASAAVAPPARSASTSAPSPRRSRFAPACTPRCRRACHLCDRKIISHQPNHSASSAEPFRSGDLSEKDRSSARLVSGGALYYLYMKMSLLPARSFRHPKQMSR